MSKKSELNDWIIMQDGYFTARQATECGYKHSLQTYHWEVGNWEKIRRGLYRKSDFPESANEDLIALSLWSHDVNHVPKLAISHDSALSIHGLTDQMPYQMRATSCKAIRRGLIDDVLIKISPYNNVDIEVHQGFLVTTPLRTINDIIDEGVLPKDIIDQAIEQSISRGLVLASELDSLSNSPR